MTAEEHDRMAAALARTLGRDVRRIDTHISTVLLSGEDVYKLKKPVDFGFLDYTALDERHRFCLEEVRINTRYVPQLYKGVVAVSGTVDTASFDGDGPVLDYAVHMARFPDEQQLDRLVEAEGLPIELAESMADYIARLHREAVPAPAESEYGTPQRVLRPMVENFELLEQTAGKLGVSEMFDKIRKWTYGEYERLEPLLQERKRRGYIRECHGDMHLHNMALLDGEVILFDAIEFNPFLNHIDIISDLAFLLMDLEFRGLHRHSRRILNRYLEQNGDYESVALLDFYKTYRAMVRAKVAALTLEQAEDETRRASMRHEVDAYLGLAESYTHRSTPFLAITYGLSGSGKSTLSLMMVDAFGALRLRSDRERMRLFKANGSGTEQKQPGRYSSEATDRTYETLLRLAETVTDAGYSAVVDATFLDEAKRRPFERLSRERHLPFLLLDLQCDEELLRERLERRRKENRDISEADLTVLEHQIEIRQPLTSDEEKYRFAVDCSGVETMKKALDTLPVTFEKAKQ